MLAADWHAGYTPWFVSLSRPNMETALKTDCSVEAIYMTKSFQRFVVAVLFSTFLGLVGLGCRTANGFGQDMEKAGESIQDGTN